MTLRDMLSELADNMTLANVAPPANDRATRLLNRAKNQIVSALEATDENYFTARSSYSVTGGDASIALPANFRRIIGLTRIDQGADIDCEIIDPRRRSEYVADWRQAIDEPAVPVLYLEGTSLYFTTRGGASENMTLLLRYSKSIADLAMSDPAATYSDIPTEWHGLIVDLATSYALPGNSPEYRKLGDRVSAGMEALHVTAAERIRDKPMRVRYVD